MSFISKKNTKLQSFILLLFSSKDKLLVFIIFTTSTKKLFQIVSIIHCKEKKLQKKEL